MDAKPTTASAAFLVGVALGGVLVAPAVIDIVRSAPSIGSLGSVGTVLVAGILALVVLVLGVFVLYLGFLFFE